MYAASLDRSAKASFWLDYARNTLEWFKKPQIAIEKGSSSWFPDGEINLTVNALDRHVDAGHGDRVAIHYHSTMGGASRSITYRELLDDVSGFAAALVARGVSKGDRYVLCLHLFNTHLTPLPLSACSSTCP
jgi:propionyl-CoA synthetase